MAANEYKYHHVSAIRQPAGDLVDTQPDEDRRPDLRRTARMILPVIVISTLLVVFAALSAEPTQLNSLQPAEAVELDGRLRSKPSTALSDLKPLELMNDGNVCGVNEELFAGLCYKTCAQLTEGAAPFRTSSWTCCKEKPCTPFNELGEIGATILCTGFDVDGKGGCPHKPGACLVDEEFHLGVCYKQCSILTRGEYPHRTGVATCCKTRGLGCLNFKQDKTSKSFAIGGGAGDGDPSTPSSIHLPQESWTEDPTMPKLHRATTGSDKKPTGAHSVDIKDLLPKEKLHDNNPCPQNEELYGGLCYARCKDLTHGEAPIRTSSWTCCEREPCKIFNQRGSIGSTLLCNGFDVSASGGCPHKPGTCLNDEEIFQGICYKSCASITNGEFPNRISFATCCKTHGLGCLNPFNDKTRKDFAVGGGANTGDKEFSELSLPHAPDERLTEAEERGMHDSWPGFGGWTERRNDDDTSSGHHHHPAEVSSKSTISVGSGHHHHPAEVSSKSTISVGRETKIGAEAE